MDGAATLVEQLAHLLPDQPHHLALSPTRRYPPDIGFPAKDSRLQFGTYISVDRGVLLTRAHYDIVDEPEAPTTASANAAARPEAKKAVNKVSFENYRQNKQKKQSESPPDSGPGASMDTKHTLAPRGADRPVQAVSRDANGGGRDSKLSASAAVNGDSRPRNPSPNGRDKPSHSPLPDGRKRAAEPESDSRPSKRTKSESFTKVDASRPSQHNSGRAREGGEDGDEKRHPREPRPARAQGTPNGRSFVEATKGNKLPSSSPRLVTNGSRARPSEDRHSTVRTGEANGRQSLPPLLSPLRLGLGDEEDRGSKSPRKRATESGGDGHLRPAAPIQSGRGPAPRRSKSPLRVPPLLSPTLPPIVEQELARVKRTPSKGDSSQRDSQASESPASAKKPRPAAETDSERGKERSRDKDREKAEKAEPRRLMVMMKFKKNGGNVKHLQRLLQLQPASQKEALRKERSISVDGTPPPSKKRPAMAEVLGESPSTKRPRATSEKTISAKPLPPSTPLKTMTMSRGPSSNSQALTPGDSNSLTPSGTGDRPSTGHGDATSSALQRRSDRYQRLGTRLKHDRDAIVKPRLTNGASARDAPAPQLRPDEKKMVAALSMEMVLSYMVGFRLLNQARAADRKPANATLWENLLPHFQELRRHTHAFRPLEALAVQLHALCLEQLTDAYTTCDAASVARDLAVASRKRAKAWGEAFHVAETVQEEQLRVVLGPWHSVEDAVRLVAPALRRWAARQDIPKYEMELSLTAHGGGA